MAVIRPLQRIFAGVVYGSDSSTVNRMRTLVFPGVEDSLASENFGMIFREATKDHLGVTINLRLYRHIAAAVCAHHPRACVPGYEAAEQDEAEQAVEDAQRGHSTRTAHQTYVVNNKSVSGVSSISMHDFMMASIRWHHLIGMDDPPPDLRKEQVDPKLTPPSSAHSRVQPIPAVPAADFPLLLTAITEATENAVTRAMGSRNRDCDQAVTSRPTQYPANLLPAFRHFMRDPAASFKCPEQLQFVTHLLAREHNLLGCLPTGSGKTLLMLFPAAIYEQTLITIVITPLDGLTADLERRCRQLPIRYTRWSLTQTENPRTPIVFASVEHASLHAFRQYLTLLHSEDLLSRIIFEEVHVILGHRSFRTCLNFLHDLRNLPVQFVFLSATFPVVLEPLLPEVFGIQHHITVRMQSARPEIGYRVRLVHTRAEALKELQNTVSRRLAAYTSGERLMVFARSVKDVVEVSDALGAPCYYASLPPDVRQQTYEDFECGKKPVIVSTTSLGNGVDIANVRDVIHFGVPYDIVTFSQESGRAGRDKRHSNSTVIVWRDWKDPQAHEEVDPDLFGARQMIQWVADSETCRRSLLSRFLDGVPVTCAELPSPNLCDTCQRSERKHTLDLFCRPTTADDFAPTGRFVASTPMLSVV